jgi:hypothetical protein
MKLSFVDEESFKEAAGSLHFNNPPSDPDILTLRGVESSITPRERNGDICFDNSSANAFFLDRKALAR